MMTELLDFATSHLSLLITFCFKGMERRQKVTRGKYVSMILNIQVDAIDGASKIYIQKKELVGLNQSKE